MVQKIRVVGKTHPRIKNTGKTQPRVSHEFVMKALGAEPITDRKNRPGHKP